MQKEKDNNGDQDETETSGGIVAPATRVGPRGNGGNQKDEDGEQQNHARLTARTRKLYQGSGTYHPGERSYAVAAAAAVSS